MADIVLSTLTAKYIHAAFGLRYLRAKALEKLNRYDRAIDDLNRTIEEMNRQAGDPTAGAG